MKKFYSPIEELPFKASSNTIPIPHWASSIDICRARPTAKAELNMNLPAIIEPTVTIPKTISNIDMQEIEDKLDVCPLGFWQPLQGGHLSG